MTAKCPRLCLHPSTKQDLAQASKLMYKRPQYITPNQRQTAGAAEAHLQGCEDAAEHEVVQLTCKALLLTAA